MKPLTAFFFASWTIGTLLRAEPLVRQDFDAFPEELAKPYKSSNNPASGTWYAFGHARFQAERARSGKAVRLKRTTDETAGGQSIHAYFRPSTSPHLVFRFWVYLEGEGGVEVGMDNHLHRLFRLRVEADRLHWRDPQNGQWRLLETPVKAKPGNWMEWIVECDRDAGTCAVRMRFDGAQQESEVAAGLPLNPDADAAQQVFEFLPEPGDPCFLDDVTLEEKP